MSCEISSNILNDCLDVKRSFVNTDDQGIVIVKPSDPQHAWLWPTRSGYMAIGRLGWRQVWVLYVYAIQGCTHITQFVLLVNIAAKYVRWCGTVACIHLDVTIKLLRPEVRDWPCSTKRPLRRDWGSCILHVYGCVLQHDWYTERKWLHMGLQNTNVTFCKDKIFWNLSKMFIVKNMKYQGPNAKFDSY